MHVNALLPPCAHVFTCSVDVVLSNSGKNVTHIKCRLYDFTCNSDFRKVFFPHMKLRKSNDGTLVEIKENNNLNKFIST